jgi:tetratricopeptide (TPR) repeat protein
LQLDPKKSSAYQRLGHVLFQQKREQDAYTAFQEAYKIDKDNVARAEVNMARRYQAAGDDARAVKLMQTAKERDPQGLQTRLAIAQWALETNRLEEAKENAAAATQIAPQDFFVKILEGTLARIDGDYAKAEAAFQQAHLMQPANYVVWNQLAIVLADQDDQAKKELALQYSQVAAKAFPDARQPAARETFIVVAWVLYRLDRLPQADATVRQALAQGGGIGADAGYFAAQIFYVAGRKDAALELLNRALDDNKQLFPNRKRAQELRGKILSEGGTP